MFPIYPVAGNGFKPLCRALPLLLPARPPKCFDEGGGEKAGLSSVVLSTKEGMRANFSPLKLLPT